ncbi:hypothetical protein [Streptomyces sp. TLI_053]|nr:hypothetical protein [Streptomyces sp. TLI_053]
MTGVGRVGPPEFTPLLEPTGHFTGMQVDAVLLFESELATVLG